MSHSSERDEGSSSVSDETGAATSALGAVRDRFEVPVLLVVVATMLWIRLRPYSNYVRGGEVLFSGNDAWYHLREVRYVVRHWPSTMPYDPWTNFPLGTSVGQFGTLYDQIVATAALIVGLGSPSPELVAKTLLVAPAVAGALTAIPAYLVAKRLAGRVPALFAAVVLMLLPGTFLQRTLAGFADHNGVEPLFQVTAVFATVVALAVAREDRPIWELVTAREWGDLRRSTTYSVLAGVAMAAYIYAWPPGVLLVGVFGVFAVLQAVSDHASGRPPEHTGFVVAVTGVTVALLTLVGIDTTSFSATRLSLLQPVVGVSVAVGGVGLAWLSRQFEARTFDNEWADENGYVATVAGTAVVGLIVLGVVDAGPLSSIEGNLLRIVGFGAGGNTLTIAEAQPFLGSRAARIFGDVGVVLREYGFAFPAAVIGAVWTLVGPMYRRGAGRDYRFIGFAGLATLVVFAGNFGPVPDVFGLIVSPLGVAPELAGVFVIAGIVFAAATRIRYEPETLFVLVWAIFMTMAAFTQNRFNYYLAVAVAVFTAPFVRDVLAVVDIDLGSGLEAPDVETYQVLTAVVVLMLVLVPVLGVSMNLGPRNAPTQNALQASEDGPDASTVVWGQSLEYLQGNTPEEGTFGDADEPMAFYGQYDRPADSDFDYSDGAYGVQSWWDYGHWITMRGERIPNANPFQEGARQAANFLLAPNESAAREALLERGEEGDQTRYVMVDYKMTSVLSGQNPKFSAPVQFYDAGNVSAGDFFATGPNGGVKQILAPASGQQRGFQRIAPDRRQRYYESTMVRLYAYHGSRAEPTIRRPLVGDRVVVFDYDVIQSQTGVEFKSVPRNGSAIQTFRNRSAAEAFVERDGSARIGGIGQIPREPVPALEHYRLVNATATTAFADGQYRADQLRAARGLGARPGTLFKNTPSWVKTFERVPGATVTGSGAEPNETVTAAVRMRIPGGQGQNATTFVYRQQATADADGEFTMTLPYATTDYDEFGPENGYTNVSVRAAGPYRVAGDLRTNESAYVLQNAAILNVSEGDVNGADDGEVSVELSETVRRAPEGATTGSGDESAGNETGGNESAALGGADGVSVPMDGSADGSERSADGTDTRGDGGVSDDTAVPDARVRSADVLSRAVRQ
ncbi:oligosaccharyl transferase, archaeosortase A system-associated [Halobaculum sp. MBLA0147]|uniref:oligosaccharyl transferase, archaeosortase A system-associated n=1 Tax=Halobaculum sp. MBLA0147 TaxID=3079934 RepID=UPI0035245312